MTLVLLALVTATVLAFVFGGRPSTFIRPALKRSGLLGIVLVSLFTSPLGETIGVYAGWLVVGALALVWFFARNGGRPGVGLAMVGLFLNAVVIMANAGMPVSIEAIERAGVPAGRLGNATDDEGQEVDDLRAQLDNNPLREELTTDTVLPWLGEAVPLALPLRPAVSSPGDVLIAAGAALFMFTGLTGLGRTVPDRLIGTREQRALRKKQKAAEAQTDDQTGDKYAIGPATADAEAPLATVSTVAPGGSGGPIGWNPPDESATNQPPNWWDIDDDPLEPDPLDRDDRAPVDPNAAREAAKAEVAAAAKARREELEKQMKKLKKQRRKLLKTAKTADVAIKADAEAPLPEETDGQPQPEPSGVDEIAPTTTPDATPAQVGPNGKVDELDDLPAIWRAGEPTIRIEDPVEIEPTIDDPVPDEPAAAHPRRGGAGS